VVPSSRNPVLDSISASPLGPVAPVGPDGTLFLCEDSDPPQYIRGLTPNGRIFDFAGSTGNETEFAGATFDPRGRTLFVNQQGDEEEGVRGDLRDPGAMGARGLARGTQFSQPSVVTRPLACK
jgi:secreted PhoX family phosphatase